MGLKLYEETSVQAIADAIRAKNGSSDTYTISEMSTAIENIPSGGSGDIYKFHWSNDSKICVREGPGEVKWFFIGYTKESDDVDVPQELIPYLPDFEAPGQYMHCIAFTDPNDSWDGSHYIGFVYPGTENVKIRSWNYGNLGGGTFWGVLDITHYPFIGQQNEYVDPTDIPDIDISLIEKTITENGTYSAEDDGYVGYSEVTVSIPSGAVIKVNKYAVVNNRVLQSVPVAFEQGKYYVAFYYDDYLYPRSGTPNKLACFAFTRSKTGVTVEQALMNYNNYNIVWYYTDESLYLNNKIDNDTVDAYITIIEIDPSVTNPLIPS